MFGATACRRPNLAVQEFMLENGMRFEFQVVVELETVMCRLAHWTRG